MGKPPGNQGSQSSSQPTMDDVAARAGVSRALVSLVMRESPRVSAHSRDKVLAAAAELGYRPNLWARRLAQGRSDTVGVMLNDLLNPYFTELAQAVATAAAERQLEVLVSSGWGRPDGESAAVESLLNLRADGMVLCGPRLGLDVLTGYAAGIPTVGISIYGQPDAFDTVCNDEANGARLIVDHLVALGHTRIAHIHADVASGGPERRMGYVDAMAANGLEPIMVAGDFTEEAGVNGAEELLALATPPTAIMAGNDLAAVGVLGRLAARGLRVPDDISVVGYDDTRLASTSTASLTTVHQPRPLMGQRTLELLVERLEGRTEARHELIKGRLVTRSSTGPVARSSPETA
ncbi:MAG: LacI family DNA-binding transcriptional regulator [Actinomycetota bacterium]